MSLEIISRQKVKPSNPTPSHLKLYKFSGFDQLYYHSYVGLVHFYLNKDEGKNSNEEELLMMARREALKKSLSQTLSRFYPLAGELSDDGFHIECNDNGAYYLETRVRGSLSDFLTRPRHSEVIKMLPFHPESPDLNTQIGMLLIQVNIFDCGGIALGLYTCHKLIDGPSYATFLRAWAEQSKALGSGSAAKQICPDFYSAPTIFVQDPKFRRNYPGKRDVKSKITSTRRFVFSASDLEALKARTGARSRVLAVIGLIWKCAMSASQKTILGSQIQKASCLLLPFNLRPKISSRLPLSPYSIGNLFWTAHAHLVIPNGLTLEMVMDSLRDGMAQIEGEDFLKLITVQEKGSEYFVRAMEEMNKVIEFAYNGVDLFPVSSMCNSGLYEADFGWGKQIWSAYGGANSAASSHVVLMDTRSGDGIEALVRLDEENIKIFEKDPEILAFATLDPSPLQTHNPLPRANL